MKKEIKITNRELIEYITTKLGNEDVVEKKKEVWLEHIVKNRKYYKNGNCEIPGLVIFIIGAGPSLKKNVEELKRIPKESKGIVVAVDAAMPYLIENDIVPNYCMHIDSDNRMWNMINNFSKGTLNTSKIKLLTTIQSSPIVIDNWKGPKYFFNLLTGVANTDNEFYLKSIIRKAKRNISAGEYIENEDFNLLCEGLEPEVQSGGNVTTIGHAFALTKMGAWKVVMVGCDFSWSEDEEFYAGSSNVKMGIERVNSCKKWDFPNIYGDKVITNMSLWKYKDWHENYNRIKFPNRLINATEGGILGMNNDGSKIEDIRIMNLKDTIDRYVFLK